MVSVLHLLSGESGEGTGGLTRGPANRALFFDPIVRLLIFPSYCRICGDLLSRTGERVVCSACLGKIAPWNGPACLCCGRFFDGADVPHPCSRCLSSPPPYSRQLSVGRYDGVLRDLILLFKYGRFSVLGQPLGRLAVSRLLAEPGMLDGVDLILPVPLHKKRRRARGFNQSAMLAREIAGATGNELLAKCLVRVKDAPPQASLEAGAREKNVRGVYAVRKPGLLKGRTILLIDDVFTTGATIGECSRVLRTAGVRGVRVLTLAQA